MRHRKPNSKIEALRSARSALQAGHINDEALNTFLQHYCKSLTPLQVLLAGGYDITSILHYVAVGEDSQEKQRFRHDLVTPNRWGNVLHSFIAGLKNKCSSQDLHTLPFLLQTIESVGGAGTVRGLLYNRDHNGSDQGCTPLERLDQVASKYPALPQAVVNIRQCFGVYLNSPTLPFQETSVEEKQKGSRSTATTISLELCLPGVEDAPPATRRPASSSSWHTPLPRPKGPLWADVTDPSPRSDGIGDNQEQYGWGSINGKGSSPDSSTTGSTPSFPDNTPGSSSGSVGAQQDQRHQRSHRVSPCVMRPIGEMSRYAKEDREVWEKSARRAEESFGSFAYRQMSRSSGNRER